MRRIALWGVFASPFAGSMVVFLVMEDHRHTGGATLWLSLLIPPLLAGLPWLFLYESRFEEGALALVGGMTIFGIILGMGFFMKWSQGNLKRKGGAGAMVTYFLLMPLVCGACFFFGCLGVVTRGL